MMTRACKRLAAATYYVALALLAALVSASAAYAQPVGGEDTPPTLDPQEANAAKAHFKAAKSLYEAGRFRLAAEEFEEAYRLSETPELLYNIYVAYRDAGEPEKALTNLRNYLEQVPDAPDRLQLEARLRSLEKLVADRKQQAPPTEAKPVQPAKTTPPITVTPSDDTGDGSFTADVLPWILAGVGGAALATGAVTGVLALGKTSDIEDNCPGDICPTDYDLDGEKSSAQTLATLTDVMLIGGGIVAATGIVLLLVLDDSEETPPTGVSASCLPGFCGALVQGKF